MNTITDLYRRRRAASVAQCEAPALLCSTCGMLECVCRPRFFAGQVLTADDLNRLDAYIRAKHRLHNRQLHGFGVVNGLEVTCNPCGDGVSVSCGYALSPCGEDIVVCDTVTVDVCALIKDCETPLPPCDPPRQPQQRECSAAEEEWVLAIRYDETPTRGVQPLYGLSGCSCGNAGCGGKAAGCGCGGNALKCSCQTKTARPRGAPVQCEPTVICEGYRFEVYRAPTRHPNDKRGGDRSALIERFRCCLEGLLEGLPPTPSEPPTGNLPGWQLWATRVKAHLLQRLQQRPGTNCALIERLATLVIPNANDPAALAAALQLLFVVLIDAIFNCLCSALLPPCPLPHDDGRVALATLHVASNPCRVLRVCNWSTHRQIAVTMPALEYWLGSLPIFAALRELLQKACCFDLAGLIRVPDQPTPGTVPVGGPPPVASIVGDVPFHSTLAHEQATLRLNPRIDQPADLQAFSRGLVQAIFTPGRTISPDMLAQGLLGGGGDLAPDRTALPQWLMFNQLARPLGEVMGPELFAVLGAGGKPPPRAADDAALIERLDALAARVAAQDKQIAALRKSSEDKPRKK